MGAKEKRGRRPFRFLFRLMVFAGIMSAAGRYLVSKRDEYAGLTETEARARMEAKLGPRLGEEKAQEIADQVIPVLKDRGMLKGDSGMEEKAQAPADTGDET